MALRSYEMWLVAYYFSRYGELSADGKTASPPLSLGVDRWKGAYEAFFVSLGDGRQLTTFVHSLKNARDSFDAHISGSGRSGWWQIPKLGSLASKVVSDWEHKPETDLLNAISEFIVTAHAAPGATAKLSFPPRRGNRDQTPGVRTSGGGDGRRRSAKSNIVGKKAEEFVVSVLNGSKTVISGSVVHHSMRGETPGYDISYQGVDRRYHRVEVKGTVSLMMTSLELSANERRAAELYGADYAIWIVVDALSSPECIEFLDPASAWVAGRIEIEPSEWLISGFRVDH